MSTSTNDRDNPANNAGVPPAPPEATATSGVGKGERRKVRIPGGFVRVALGEELPAGVEVWRDPVRSVAMGFCGKRMRPDWYYRFGDDAALERHVDAWLAGLRRREVARVERRAERKAAAAVGHGCKAGDVFCCTWGYEQTNVDYYQVTALHGRTMATVRRIATQSEETGWLRGESAPVPGRFLDEKRYPPMRVRLHGGDTPHFRVHSFARAYLMRPTAQVGGLATYETAAWSAYA